MGTSRNWFKSIRRKFVRPSARDIIVACANQEDHSQEQIVLIAGEETPNSSPTSPKFQKRVVVPIEQDVAATKIQAAFRGHLARRAFRALRSLVKVQALVRGVHVRNQSRIAMQCMHALVKLQVSVHARQQSKQRRLDHL